MPTGSAVRPDERAIVAALSAHSLFLGAGVSFFMSAAYALFLADFDADRLPFVYVACAVLVPAFGVVQTRVGSRASFSAAQLGNVGLVLALLVGALVLLATGRPAWLVFLLPVGIELLLASFSLGFWPLASRLFDVRQAKRLFPLLGAGFRVGAIAGGLGTVALIERVGAVGLVAITAGCYVVGFVSLALVLARNRRALGEAARGKGTRSARAEPESVRSLLGQRFVLLMVVFAALPSVAYNLIDFLFLEGVELRFDTENAVASFVGGFRSVQNVALLACLLFVGGRLMSRYGVRFGLLAKPVALLALLLPALVLGASSGASPAFFWVLAALKLVDVLMRFVFEVPATHVIKLALPEARLARVNSLVESSVRPVMNGVGGLTLLAVQALVPNAGTLVRVLLLGIVVVWFFVAGRLSREYGRALSGALGRRSIEGAGFTVTDATTARALRERAAGASAPEALYALRLLEDGAFEDLESVLGEALEHPSMEVRVHALEAIERRGAQRLARSVRRLVDADPSGVVRARALRVSCALEGDERTARSYSSSDDPALRAEALAVLARGDDASSAAEELARMLPGPDSRAHRAALAAAGRARTPRLLAAVTDRLREPGDQRAAVAALAEAGDDALAHLEPILAAPVGAAGPALSTVAHAVRACARIATEPAHAVLARHLGHPSGAVRRRVIVALRQNGYAAAEEERARVLERVGAERASAACALEALRDLRAEPGCDLLVRGLASHAAACRARIFGLLALLGERETLVRAELGLRSASARRRALAHELVETSLPAEYADLKDLLTVEGADPEHLAALAADPDARAPDPGARLAELARADLPAWLRNAAASLTRGDRSMDPLIENALFLKGTPIFAEVDEEDLEEIAALLETVELAAGETVFEEGEPARHIFFLVAGRVEFRGPRGLEREIPQGDCFGDIPVLARIDYPGTAVCLDDCTLLRLDGHAFGDLLVQNGALAYGIIGQLLDRVLLLGRELGFEFKSGDGRT